jgi:hypothetical protein
MIESEIVHTALENLRRSTQIEGTWIAYATDKDQNTDGELVFGFNKSRLKMKVEVKKTLRHYHVSNILDLAKANAPFLLVAEHIFPKIKEELRKSGISYLEANGNIYLKDKGVYVWIENQKPLQSEKEKANRAFSKTGLKVIFHFLINDRILNITYRDIAYVAEVALGNINYVFNGLKQLGYIQKLNKYDYQLVNKQPLLEKWVAAYAERLQPALHIGNFRFMNEDDRKNWKQLHLNIDKTCWGGEPAAAILTNYLRPEIFKLYTAESRNELINNYRLIPDDKGAVKVYKKFWNAPPNNNKTAPEELIYADLLNTGDSRCIETAEKLYNEQLRIKYQ